MTERHLGRIQRQTGYTHFMQLNNKSILVQARENHRHGKCVHKASSLCQRLQPSASLALLPKPEQTPVQERPTQSPVQNTETLIKTTM